MYTHIIYIFLYRGLLEAVAAGRICRVIIFHSSSRKYLTKMLSVSPVCMAMNTYKYIRDHHLPLIVPQISNAIRLSSM